ncbi:hypothetical protein X777_12657 [Ooceraea biroi]|uniref:Uncharacterized protein n=1 Tax=Ooceraea biroi TaxID=2015173 RepID=A0A026W1X1_OOCBI|nr:hypothetical protein X777_12657 [Ooceraea biroi]
MTDDESGNVAVVTRFRCKITSKEPGDSRSSVEVPTNTWLHEFTMRLTIASPALPSCDSHFYAASLPISYVTNKLGEFMIHVLSLV